MEEPNLKPPPVDVAAGSVVVAAALNLKPPKDVSDLLVSAPTNLNPPPPPKLNSAGLAASPVDAAGALPGLGDSQAMQVVLSASLVIMHTSHVHFEESVLFFMNLAIRGSGSAATGWVTGGLKDVAGAPPPPPGLGDSQAIHVILSASLVIMQTSQVQLPDFLVMNLAIRSSGFEVPFFFSSSPSVFSSSFVSAAGAASSSFFSSVLGLPRKLKASSALLLLEVKPPNLTFTS